jgi:hypothetical protein
MKNLYTLLAIVLFANLALTINAQICVPDPQYTIRGVYPDSATGLAPAEINKAYSQVITVVVPVDTTVALFGTVPIDSFVVSNISGLPLGLIYECAPSNCNFPGGSSYCAKISGTILLSSQIGTHTVNLTVKGYLGGVPLPLEETLDYYKIVVTGPGNVTEAKKPSFELREIAPNPIHSVGRITLNSIQNENLTLRVFDLLGKEVMTENIVVNQGVNSVDVNFEKLSSGLHIVTLSGEQGTDSKRLVIAPR